MTRPSLSSLINHRGLVAAALLCGVMTTICSTLFTATAFSVAPPLFSTIPAKKSSTSSSTILYQSSFASDSSEYSSKDMLDMDDPDSDSSSSNSESYDERRFQDETPTVELQPIPMSKNSGNRFVAFYWDAQLNDDAAKDVWDLHYDRIALTEQHVMYCRKANLYNETFNQESMVDILWSFPILSSDLRRLIGHAVCMESTALEHVHDFMRHEPLSQMLTRKGDGDAAAAAADDDDVEYDIGRVDLYRWRHIRDYTLRIDDGRTGYPCLCLNMDVPSEQDKDAPQLRQQLQNATLEYMIRSERIIAAGPLFLPTAYKDDPSSMAVGDLMLINAENREDAIAFVEDLPTAQAGLYESMRVNFYNTLDITGKFVSEDPLRDAPCGDLKEAMEVWGYPVDDDQTPWLNW